MTHPFRNTALELYMDVLPQLAAAGCKIRPRNKNLANQLDSSAQSVAATLAEADTPCRGNSRSRLETAFGSLRETRTHLRVAAVYDFLDEAEMDDIDSGLDRVAAMIWKRIRARRR